MFQNLVLVCYSVLRCVMVCYDVLRCVTLCYGVLLPCRPLIWPCLVKIYTVTFIDHKFNQNVVCLHTTYGPLIPAITFIC
jgi:hypothetical protein